MGLCPFHRQWVSSPIRSSPVTNGRYRFSMCESCRYGTFSATLIPLALLQAFGKLLDPVQPSMELFHRGREGQTDTAIIAKGLPRHHSHARCLQQVLGKSASIRDQTRGAVFAI